jgi:PAS domain S-box-containing protein
VDVDGTVKEFNKGAEVLLGYTAEELVGKRSVAIFHSINEVVERSQYLSKEFDETIEPGFDVFLLKLENLGLQIRMSG